MIPRPSLCILTVLFAMTGAVLADSEAPATDSFGKIDCQALRESVTRPRWLSLPKSRLVVNPRLTGYGPDAPAASLPEDLPTDLAYFVGEEPVRLPAFWSWQTPSARTVRELAGPKIDLSPSAGSLWKSNRVRADFSEESARLTVTEGNFGNLSRTVTVDLDRTPTLFLRVPGGSGSWCVKVNDGRQPVDIRLIEEQHSKGTFIADVRAVTGWQGTHTFDLLLFAVGPVGSTASFADLQFYTLGSLPRIATRQTVWSPAAIWSEASSADHALRVESTVMLPDAASVAQRLRVLRAGDGTLRLTGQFSEGTVRWDAQRRALLLQGAGFHAVIALSRPARWLGIRPSAVDWMTGTGPANSASGVWALALDRVKAGDEIVVAARFAPTASGLTATEAAARTLAASRPFAASLGLREAAWNRLLAAAPRPLDFTFRQIDPRGVTPTQARRTYYRAWAFLLANTLPPMPENHFAFPQCACGKPSLWNEGAPRALPSAQWESFLAMQALALVDPQTAWAAYEGQMSLVASDGSLNGEGLPSCHAQTAWTLYEATGDRARLKRIYPALKRMLLWKIANPRWIYHGSTGPADRDNEFVVHALTDIAFAGRIAETLGMPGEAAFWQAQRRTMAAQYRAWFWPSPDGPSYAGFNVDSGKRWSADNSWNLQGLILTPDILDAPSRKNLLALFRTRYRPALPFAVIGVAKFPDFEHTRRGLFQSGLAAETAALSEVALRDVTLAGDYSEDYSEQPPVRSTGVRTSVFGARHAVDSVLWRSGIIIDEGLPVLIGVPNAVGVTNLPIRGKRIRVRFTTANCVVLDGPGLRFLRLPPGFRALPQTDRALRWEGTIPTGEQIHLEARH